MRVIQNLSPTKVGKPTVKQAINAKMKVLREFHIVNDYNDYNADEIKCQLQNAIDAQPHKDYELVLDRVAHTMIANRLND